ncbi:hypothetical protein ABZY34_25665 [Streptomyces virginiae]|uniref:hypothetical protein n=1 Tax=Streptomyces virginiae TaxID=1961 RepID=UPI0033A40A3A
MDVSPWLRPDADTCSDRSFCPTFGRGLGKRFSATWGSRDVLDTTLVHPALGAEVSADRAIDHGGVCRHPLRFQRLRLDVGLEDVPGFGEGPAAAG